MPKTYSFVDSLPASFKPGRGFATELAKSLTSLQPASAEAILNDLMTDNGDGSRYARVAPQAAALRPMRPVVWQLRRWAEAGLVNIVVTEAASAEAILNDLIPPVTNTVDDLTAQLKAILDAEGAKPEAPANAPAPEADELINDHGPESGISGELHPDDAPAMSKSLAKKLAKAAARANASA